MLFFKDKDKESVASPLYKFKSIRAYNWANTVNGQNMYRRVFDVQELAYLGVELCLYNKKFDESDWKTVVKFLAFEFKDGKKGKQICEIVKNREVSRNENLLLAAEGYGSDEVGKFWEKGRYIWEAYLDDKFVASHEFFIEDVGVVNKYNNPYFDYFSLKVYESSNDNTPIEERKHLKVFDTEKTRYIFGELKIVDFVNREWPCELFFNFFDDTGQLAGQSVFYDFLSPTESDYTFNITAGWGGPKVGNWKKDEYTLEVVFQEQLVAVVPFAVEDYEKEVRQAVSEPNIEEKEDEEISLLDDTLEGDNNESPEEEESPETDENPDEEIEIPDENVDHQAGLKQEMEKLGELIGLKTVKEKIKEHISYIDFLKVRKDLGYDEEKEISLHSVFTGNPGTGKTTVVKLLGKIYHHMGLLSKGHVHTVESMDLISGFVRQTGKDTKDHIEKARGGILFIDEAYMLYKKKSENDFGDEAVAALITEISDGAGDIAIMVAGYPKEMKEFINSNPGLKSRFKNYFHFDDFTPKEMLEISDFAADNKNVGFSKDAKEKLYKEIIRAYRKRDRTFGNARFVHSIVDEAKMSLGVRVMKSLGEEEINKHFVSTVEVEDLEEVFKPGEKKFADIPIDEELLAEALSELKAMTGLNNIKQEINDLVKLVRYYRDLKKDFRKAFSIHSVFTGNPGTGKTTVARIMGKIYKSLGVLERGHLIETDSSDMIAGFVGQTAIKAKELINEAQGGILFIDEAYALTDGNNSDFGKKAVATLLKEMEARRGQFSVIVAGYPLPMKDFIQSNPGLKSRFDQTLVFQDLSAGDLNEIAIKMLASHGLEPDKEAADYLKKYLEHISGSRNQYFGNARSVRKIVERTVRNQNLRMAEMKTEERSKEAMKTIVIADIEEFEIDGSLAFSSIGFKFGNQK
jgi:SpoVK/Ycf46/Vps4 family AAA+-type ATPase